MESTESKRLEVTAERSYIACFNTGLRTAFQHMDIVLRYSWPSILLTVLIPIPGFLYLLGQQDALLHKWEELGYVPDVKASALQGDTRRYTVRNARVFLIMGAIMLAAGIVIVLPLAACLYLARPLWMGLLCSTVLLLAAIPLDAAVLDMRCSHKPLGQCLATIAFGYRHFGSLFAFALLSFFFVAAVSLMGGAPLITAAGVAGQGAAAAALGDKLDYPLLFPLVCWLAYAICMAAFLVATWALGFSRYLLWGALLGRREEAEATDGQE